MYILPCRAIASGTLVDRTEPVVYIAQLCPLNGATSNVCALFKARELGHLAIATAPLRDLDAWANGVGAPAGKGEDLAETC